MIIIGYQGIGKSTTVSQNDKFIDLESGNFWIEDEETGIKSRDKNWFIPYCNIAEHLSQQGYTVFVSSHKEVRERLKKSKELVVGCYPAHPLKNEWIKRLENRWKDSGSDKDYKALANAVDRFDENIDEIEKDCRYTIKIESMHYSLASLIAKFMYFYKRGETI